MIADTLQGQTWADKAKNSTHRMGKEMGAALKDDVEILSALQKEFQTAVVEDGADINDIVGRCHTAVQNFQENLKATKRYLDRKQ